MEAHAGILELHEISREFAAVPYWYMKLSGIEIQAFKMMSIAYAQECSLKPSDSGSCILRIRPITLSFAIIFSVIVLRTKQLFVDAVQCSSDNHLCRSSRYHQFQTYVWFSDHSSHYFV